MQGQCYSDAKDSCISSIPAQDPISAVFQTSNLKFDLKPNILK